MNRVQHLPVPLPGTKLIFRGLTWVEEHWENNVPVIIYSPVQILNEQDFNTASRETV